MTPDLPVLVVRKKQLLWIATAILIPALSYAGSDYIATRDLARSVKQQADSLEQDVRETRQNVLQSLIMMNRQFTGDEREISRLQQELGKLKAEAESAKEVSK